MARRFPPPRSVEHRSHPTVSLDANGFPHRRIGTQAKALRLSQCIKRSMGAGMSCEKAAVYRLHAAHCTELAQRISDPKGRLSLWEMSRMWLRLAELSEAEQSAVAIAETDAPETAR